MAKDILMYGRIDSFSAIDFFDRISKAQEQDENVALKFRVNTPGGEPEYGWGMCAKINETANKILAVDGKAYSWGAFTCLYSPEVECLDVSQFMFHRAAYGEWFEQSEYFTDELKQNLLSINSKLEKAFRNKIDVAAFENLKQCKEKGITVKSLFSMDSRIDVFFDAKDAKAIGLVSNIIKLTPSKRAEIESIEKDVVFTLSDEFKIAAYSPAPQNAEIKVTDMTIEKLKAEFPAVYAAIMTLGKEEGLKEEKTRVQAWLAFVEIDKETVIKAVKEGSTFDQAASAEMTVKGINAMQLKAVAKDNPANVVTTDSSNDAPKTEKEKTLASFEALIDKKSGKTAHAIESSVAMGRVVN